MLLTKRARLELVRAGYLNRDYRTEEPIVFTFEPAAQDNQKENQNAENNQ